MLRAAREAGAGDLWCLGDLTGYGADPEYCVATITQRASRCIAGNHDLAVTGAVPIERFSGHVHQALEWTRSVLSPELLATLAALLPSDAKDGPLLAHGSPRDPIWEYILGSEQALEILRDRREPLAFTGHTHLPAYWHMTPVGDLQGGFVAGIGEVALAEGRWLVNPGSVGQPRDGDARASWLLYDPDAKSIAFRRTPYDVAGAQNAILEAGLPEELANRLAEGR